VQVAGDVEVHAAAGFVALHDAVAAVGVGVRVEVREVRAGGAGFLARVPQAVRADVVGGQELRLERRRQFVVRGARVGEVGAAAVARWRELVGAQEGEAGTARVEGTVDVEERVALTEPERSVDVLWLLASCTYSAHVVALAVDLY